MAYVAVSGGKEAIEESIKLLDFYKNNTQKDIDLESIEKKMRLLLDRVMSEAGLYCKSYAALALKQCEGSIEEAVFLLRAYRSTLTRNYYTKTVVNDNMKMHKNYKVKVHNFVHFLLVIKEYKSYHSKTINGKGVHFSEF